MIFTKPKNLKWHQIALMPVALPMLAALLVPFAALAVVDVVRDRLRFGVWT
jgi:hypothetical protein